MREPVASDAVLSLSPPSLSLFMIGRRSFLQAAAPLLLGLRTIAHGQVIQRGSFTKDDVPLARQQLLEMVNAERKRLRLSALELDDLACKVANDHALDMVEGKFLSHWGRDGRKPYQRYAFAGGTDATQENVSMAHEVPTVSPAGIRQNLFDMHQSMFDEAPPEDGHRQTILFPHHTHVGFGIAVKDYDVRLDEIYVCRYVLVDPISLTARPGSRINFGGRLLDTRYKLSGIYLYHEPLPAPPSIEWLRIPRSYSLPATYVEFLPRLPSGYSYRDGTKGSIEISDNGRFRAPLTLLKEPGVNTIVVWIEHSENEEPFPVTHVCIRCE